MKKITLLFLFVILFSNVVVNAHRERKEENQLTFIENKGQWASPEKFRANLNGAAFFIEENGYTVTLIDGAQYQQFLDNKTNPLLKASGVVDAHAFRVTFVDANDAATVRGIHKKDYYHNYFLGKEAKQWAGKVPLFDRVETQQLYPGIDLHFYQYHSHLKYEFLIAPHVSPDLIAWEYDGVNKLSLQQGNLVVGTSVGEMIEMTPVAFQFAPNGDTIWVDCDFVVKKNKVSFNVGKYNPSLPLLIDPTLVFSTYSGSTADNWGFTATFDSHGNVFAGGIAFATGYPTTTGGYQIDYAGGQVDITISKFTSDGEALLYSTYIGGEYVEMPHSLIANHNDELYVFGTTSSSNFPVTDGCLQDSLRRGVPVVLSNAVNYVQGSDMFILKLSEDGSELLASTYIGGTGNDGLNLSLSTRKNYADEVRGEIILDDHSNVYIASSTFSLDFPTTEYAFQPLSGGIQDACLFVVNHNLTDLIWGTYLGGSGNEAGYSMVVNADASIFLTGGTTSTTFPTSSGVIQPTYGGGTADGFVARIAGDGSEIEAATFLGKTGYDQGYLIKSDRDNNAYIYGQSDAPLHSWVVNAAWSQNNGQFLTKLSPYLNTIAWSTEFGSTREEPDISPTALLVDLCNKIYMSGWGAASVNGFGGTSGLPITSDAQQPTTDGQDYYLICISDDASSLYYATYFGGDGVGEHVDGGTSRFDRKGRIYQAVCAGCGGNSTFPTTPQAWSRSNNSHNCNLGVFKMDFNLPAVVADFNLPVTVCAPVTIELDNRSQTISDTTTFFWNFGDGSTSTEQFPTHTFTEPGYYTITLVVSDQGTCNFSDTMRRDMLVLANSSQTLPTLTLCNGSYVQLGFPPSPDPDITYTWLPDIALSNPNISNPTAIPDTTTLYTLLVSNGVCFDTVLQEVKCIELEIIMEENHRVCKGESILLEPSVVTNAQDVTYQWSFTPNFTMPINNNNTPAFEFTPTQATTLLYLKVAADGCEEVLPITVERIALQLASQPGLVNCFSDSIEIAVQTNYPNCSFEWFPTEHIRSGANTASPIVIPPSTMDFYVRVTTPEGCVDSLTVRVVKQEGTFPTEPEAWASESEIYKYETTTLFSTNYNTSGYLYQWMPTATLTSPNAASTEAAPLETTTYTVTITDLFGCFKRDTVTVEVSERICDEPYIFIPNAFTPNNDTKNDVLYVRSEILQSTIVFKIFNKWGELVFESNNIEKGWDGTYLGKECMPGVYDYYIEGVCFENEKFFKKGNVTLIR